MIQAFLEEKIVSTGDTNNSSDPILCRIRKTTHKIMYDDQSYVAVMH